MTTSFLKTAIPKLLVSLICLIFLPSHVMDQETETKNESVSQAGLAVKWVTQFSSLNDLKKRNKISHLVFNFLFGSGERSLVRPISMVCTSTNEWIILDQGSYQVVRIRQEESDFTNLSLDAYPSLVGICATIDDQIYFTDSQLNKVFTGRISGRKFPPINDTLDFARPTGIAFLPSKQELWVVETQAHCVTIISMTGLIVKHIGKRGTAPGEFNFPTYIWIDKKGLVYIVDSMNFRIQVMNQEGEFLLCFGEAGDATGFFARPKGVATDSYGNIYVVDALFHSVQIFNGEGQYLSNFGERGSAAGQFWLPMGIYIDDHNNIYVSDSYNSRIQVFQLADGGRSEN